VGLTVASYEVRAMIRVPCFMFVEAESEEEAIEKAKSPAEVWVDQTTDKPLGEHVAFGEGDEIYEVNEG
jgi:hypothetical protein